MPWGRCDDTFWRHSKVIALNDLAAVGLHWTAISWCNDQLTDGLVTTQALRRLRGTPSLAAKLVAAGLWETREEGWRIHDFLHFNRSRAYTENLRVERSAAGRAGAASKWHSKPEGNSDAPLPVVDSLRESRGKVRNGPVRRIGDTAELQRLRGKLVP
jgi:hypothetical protein